jgi:hypothetical protein
MSGYPITTVALWLNIATGYSTYVGLTVRSDILVERIEILSENLEYYETEAAGVSCLFQLAAWPIKRFG